MRTFRAWSFVAAVLICGAASCPAQTTHGYIFAAPGRSAAGYTEHVGIGGELALPKRFGVGMEFGLHAHANSLTRVRSVSLLVPVDGYFHFPLSNPVTKWDPFVVAGVTVVGLQWDSVPKVFHYGGGTNYWFARHAGIRMAFRDHLRRNYGGGFGHVWEVRFALAVRP